MTLVPVEFWTDSELVERYWMFRDRYPRMIPDTDRSKALDEYLIELQHRGIAAHHKFGKLQ